MRISILCVVCSFAFTSAGMSQETVRRVQGAGEHNKFLTPGTLDRWILQVEAGETLLAHVRTREFDPILELAVPGEKEDKVLLSVDDDGSESRFAYRFTKGGEYRIRVHGYEYKGGGNYTLSLRRFHATEMSIDKPTVGTFDRKGRSYHYFNTEEDQMLTVDPTGARSWELLDVKGKTIYSWRGSIHHRLKGEHYVVLHGAPATRYQLKLRPARRKDLVLNDTTDAKLEDRQLDVHAIKGKVGDFRVIEIRATGDVASRLVHAPLESKKKDGQKITRSTQPAIQYLRTVNKGGAQRFAVLLGRNDRYQLQIISSGGSAYDLKMTNPTVPIQVGQRLAKNLPVGKAGYYKFKGTPGQLIIARLNSAQFDPFLKLYDSQGRLITENDDGDGGIGSRISHIVMKEQTFQLHVTSLGNGGGGNYELSLEERKAKPLVLNKVAKSRIEDDSTDHWYFDGKKGQAIFFNVRSLSFDPQVAIRDPDGVQLGQDDNGGIGNDSLLAIRLPRDGRYTLWVTSRRGKGEYQIRPINGE